MLASKQLVKFTKGFRYGIAMKLSNGKTFAQDIFATIHNFPM